MLSRLIDKPRGRLPGSSTDRDRLATQSGASSSTPASRFMPGTPKISGRMSVQRETHSGHITGEGYTGTTWPGSTGGKP